MRSIIVGAVVALSAAVYAADPLASKLPPGATPRAYSASCSVVDATHVEGFVTAPAGSQVVVAGPVKFRFPQTNSMEKPEVTVEAGVVVAPGKTERVARATLTGSVGMLSGCQFDPAEAIR